MGNQCMLILMGLDVAIYFVNKTILQVEMYFLYYYRSDFKQYKESKD